MKKTLFFFTVISLLLFSLIGCSEKSTSAKHQNISYSSDQTGNAAVVGDEIIIPLNRQLYVFNMQNQSFSRFCQVPGCTHEDAMAIEDSSCIGIIGQGTVLGESNGYLYTGILDSSGLRIFEYSSDQNNFSLLLKLAEIPNQSMSNIIFEDNYCYYLAESSILKKVSLESDAEAEVLWDLSSQTEFVNASNLHRYGDYLLLSGEEIGQSSQYFIGIYSLKDGGTRFIEDTCILHGAIYQDHLYYTKDSPDEILIYDIDSAKNLSSVPIETVGIDSSIAADQDYLYLSDVTENQRALYIYKYDGTLVQRIDLNSITPPLMSEFMLSYGNYIFFGQLQTSLPQSLYYINKDQLSSPDIALNPLLVYP